jgi:hypothetical protein
MDYVRGSETVGVSGKTSRRRQTWEAGVRGGSRASTLSAWAHTPKMEGSPQPSAHCVIFHSPAGRAFRTSGAEKVTGDEMSPQERLTPPVPTQLGWVASSPHRVLFCLLREGAKSVWILLQKDPHRVQARVV